MASHVVVVDSSLKRTTIKTTPTKHLSDVLQEACSKLGLNAQNHTLKHGNKQIDLSRTIRLSGLSPGAKLSLVQASRSPSVVSVALQLPIAGDASGSFARLTEKFPSNTSIWQILRRFESGATSTPSSTNPTHNFTQRATPLVKDGRSSGAGRLCYEMPVVNLMGRELSSFIDLQKTLNQLGYNSGSCLLRLSFRNTQQPLEDAMAEISQYFAQDETPSAPPPSASTDTDSLMTEPPPLTESDPNGTASTTTREALETSTPNFQTSASASSSTAHPAPPNNTSPQNSAVLSQQTAQPTSEISVFAPPASTSPAASQANYDESDYIPSIEQAQLHQANLVTESRNKKLLSDEELAAQEQARAETLATVRNVVVRLRFPDQSQAQRSFDQTATTADLYDMCREVMDRPNDEDFQIRISRAKGALETVPEGTKKLIQGFGWQGRVLLTIVWGDNVSAERRRKPCLKEKYRQKAESMKIDLPESSSNPAEDSAARSAQGPKQEKSQGSSSGPKQDVETKLRGFLKGLSKK